jgi:hypothetical protein
VIFTRFHPITSPTTAKLPPSDDEQNTILPHSLNVNNNSNKNGCKCSPPTTIVELVNPFPVFSYIHLSRVKTIGLSYPAPISAPSKNSRSGISWMG